MKRLLLPTWAHGRGVFSRMRGVSCSAGLVLGIETSCDDTGAAVVDPVGNILGEALHSQTAVHFRHGGINPYTAQQLHRQNIDSVVQQTLADARINIQDVGAIATTVTPGLGLSLMVGLQYSKSLVRQYNKPFIPVNHMQAHALTIRMIEKVEFPFLVLLISGGHCLICLARDIDDFLLLGKSLDDAPGELLDKAARYLNLRYHPDYQGMGGGQAIEKLAQNGATGVYKFTVPMRQYRNCDFSFSGLKELTRQQILKLHVVHGSDDKSAILPESADIAAALQHTLVIHLMERLQRAMIFCEREGHIEKTQHPKDLVVSGGVASNSYIRNSLGMLCEREGYTLHCPPPQLCTDNGIMIAWAGQEKFQRHTDVITSPEDLDKIDYLPKSTIGACIRDRVELAGVKAPLKVKQLHLDSS